MDSDEAVTVMAQHLLRPGKDAIFEKAEVQLMDKLMATRGVLGYQILKRIGFSTLGSGHATTESMMADMISPSGQNLKRTAEVWEGYTVLA